MRACPACFARVPIGDATCPACGREVGRAGRAASSRPIAPPPVSTGPAAAGGPGDPDPGAWVAGAGSAFEALTPLRPAGVPETAVDDQHVEIGRRADGPDQPAAGTRRRRSLVVGLSAVAVVAITAVGIQAVLGDEDGDSTGAVPTTAAPSTTPATATPATAPTAAEAVTPTSERRRRRRPVLGTRTGTNLVVDTDQGVVLVDLDSGRAESLATELPDGRWSNGQLTTAGHVIVADRERVQAVARGAGGPAVDLGPGCAATASEDPAVVWVSSCDAVVVPRLVMVATGQEVGPLELPSAAELVGQSPAGLVVQGPSGIYLVDSGSYARVADGRALATVGDRVVRVVCDEALACQLTAFDVRSGEDLVLSAPAEALATATYRLRPFGPKVSPDGTRVALTLFDYGDSSLWMVDVAAGTVTRVPGSDSVVGPSAAWSADGQWLLFQPYDEAVRAWPVGSDTSRVLDGLPDGRLVGAATSPEAAQARQ